jgi:hypothetical protein
LSVPSVAQTQPQVIVQGGDASEVSISDGGVVRHNAAGFVFPQQLGDMPLRKVIIYGKADVSVDYTLRGGGNGDAWISFFVYPVTRSFKDETTDIEQTIMERMAARRIPAPAVPPVAAGDGKSVWFTGKIEVRSFTSGYTLVQRGDWFLETRYSIPAEAGQGGIDRTVKALESVPWDWRPQVDLKSKEAA